MRAVYIQTGKCGASGLHAGLFEASSNQVIGELAGAAAIPANLQRCRATSRRDGRRAGVNTSVTLPQSKRRLLRMQKLSA